MDCNTSFPLLSLFPYCKGKSPPVSRRAFAVWCAGLFIKDNRRWRKRCCTQPRWGSSAAEGAETASRSCRSGPPPDTGRRQGTGAAGWPQQTAGQTFCHRGASGNIFPGRPPTAGAVPAADRSAVPEKSSGWSPDKNPAGCKTGPARARRSIRRRRGRCRRG